MTQSELASLPVAERIRMMEALWESLSADTSSAEAVPDWHAEVLRERAQLFDNGSETVTDWSDAKHRIRQQSQEK
jgi:putative addiction module component (TIGR02574 family)